MDPEVSLRDALENAYDDTEREPAGSSEAGGSTEDTSQQVRDTTPTERSEPTATVEASDDTGSKTTDDPSEKSAVEVKAAEPKDKAPESWKPAVREFWQKLPPEARAEIARREGEMNQFVQRTAAQRKIADSFIQAITPYEAMIRSEGGNPIETVNNLLATAAFLRTGPAVQKAQLVAKLVKDFGISIRDLDAALVGEDIPPDPDAKLQALLDQRLKPVNDLLNTVNQAKTQREEQTSQAMDEEITKFANNPKNEFFVDVKDDMADMVELAARRGRPITLQQAYERAIALDPEIQATLKKRVQAKKNAGGSLPLRGPQAGTGQGKGTLRDDLLASIDAVANR